jgi:uncharacterized Ntn-hydrolase superfamily protein
MLASERCWEAMVDAFEGTVGALADRLLIALDAAEREGGDARGRQAARLLVCRAESSGPPWQDRVFDLRVVDDSEPLLELRRLVNVKRAYDHWHAPSSVGGGRLTKFLKLTHERRNARRRVAQRAASL